MASITLIPDVTLPPSRVMLLLTDSVLEHPFEDAGQALNSGIIKKIFATSSIYSEGDVVLFPINKSEKIGYSGNVFYLVEEQYIFFKENPYTPS